MSAGVASSGTWRGNGLLGQPETEEAGPRKVLVVIRRNLDEAKPTIKSLRRRHAGQGIQTKLPVTGLARSVDHGVHHDLAKAKAPVRRAHIQALHFSSQAVYGPQADAASHSRCGACDEKCAAGRHIGTRQGGEFGGETLVLEISADGCRILTKQVAGDQGRRGAVDLRQHDFGNCHGRLTPGFRTAHSVFTGPHGRAGGRSAGRHGAAVLPSVPCVDTCPGYHWLAFFGKPGLWARTTQKRCPVGASITTQRSRRRATLAPRVSRRATSAGISSVSMSRCTRLSWSTRWICTMGSSGGVSSMR